MVRTRHGAATSGDAPAWLADATIESPDVLLLIFRHLRRVLGYQTEQLALTCHAWRDAVAATLRGDWALLRFERSIGGPGALPGQFAGPNAIEVMPGGRIIVSDRSNHRLQLIAPAGKPAHFGAPQDDAVLDV